jgi:hypothetical protein
LARQLREVYSPIAKCAALALPKTIRSDWIPVAVFHTGLNRPSAPLQM